ncbi:glycosyltransferase-like domain-containing protein 1 [Mercenaria mercenaria]|uniref:glycosyltransferase-like domain-containing protein 1 n=1 Tax=Mercenaria mercenaria TaxID=6596 RepID=UPI00234E8F88|nr:glycosyltransferase-like domain-containing protein 1 [Mercenaria mercenaria]
MQNGHNHVQKKLMEKVKILLIEPFYAGSHKQLIDLLHKEVPGTELMTLPGKKWHWKARTSALWFSQAIPREHNFRTLFTSSVLNLAELTALRPDLAALHKVIYFHENQLVYPVRKQQNRDFQFGYNQILSSIVADAVLFNSKYNMDSFLSNINSHLKLIPDHRPKGIVEQIRSKCHVLHYPIIFPTLDNNSQPHDSRNKDFDDCSQNDMEICEGNSDMNVEMKRESKDSLQKPNTVNGTESKEIVPKVLTESLNCDIEDSRASNLTVKSDTNKDKSDTIVVKTDTGEGKTETVEGITDIGEKVEDRSDAKVENCNAQSRKYSDAAEELPAKKSKMMEHTQPLHILWPHRWEHDKDPQTFFNVLTRLHNDGLDFRISVLGEMYSEVPAQLQLLGVLVHRHRCEQTEDWRELLHVMWVFILQIRPGHVTRLEWFDDKQLSVKRHSEIIHGRQN